MLCLNTRSDIGEDWYWLLADIEEPKRMSAIGDASRQRDASVVCSAMFAYLPRRVGTKTFLWVR